MPVQSSTGAPPSCTTRNLAPGWRFVRKKRPRTDTGLLCMTPVDSTNPTRRLASDGARPTHETDRVGTSSTSLSDENGATAVHHSWSMRLPPDVDLDLGRGPQNALLSGREGGEATVLDPAADVVHRQRQEHRSHRRVGNDLGTRLPQD